LDGPLPKLCPAVTLSNQDGHHSAVALLLKAALIQVSDNRLLGASGCTILSVSVKMFTCYKFDDSDVDYLISPVSFQLPLIPFINKYD
jgi:hypothetical protein